MCTLECGPHGVGQSDGLKGEIDAETGIGQANDDLLDRLVLSDETRRKDAGEENANQIIFRGKAIFAVNNAMTGSKYD